MPRRIIAPPRHGFYRGITELEVTLRAGETVEAVNRIVLEVETVAHPNVLYVPLTLLGSL